MSYTRMFIDSMRAKVYSGEITKSEFHATMGMYYGYKMCCIKNYVNLEKLGLAPAGFMSRVLDHDNTADHVLCVMCHEKWDRENPDAPRERPVFIDPATGLDVPDDEYTEWRPENQGVKPKVVFLTNTYK